MNLEIFCESSVSEKSKFPYRSLCKSLDRVDQNQIHPLADLLNKIQKALGEYLERERSDSDVPLLTRLVYCSARMPWMLRISPYRRHGRLNGGTMFSWHTSQTQLNCPASVTGHISH